MSSKLFACGDVVNCKTRKNFIGNSLKQIIRDADSQIITLKK